LSELTETPSRSEIERSVIEIVARSLERPVSAVHLNSRFWGDLDAESLDMLDIVYAIEKRFRIRMPRLNLLTRAIALFGEEKIVERGVVTETGLALMRLSMPEVPPDWITPGMRMYDFRRLISVESFVRVVERCIASVGNVRCDTCGGPTRMANPPEMALQCELCHRILDLPSGEQLLVDDLKRSAQQLNLAIIEASAPAEIDV